MGDVDGGGAGLGFGLAGSGGERVKSWMGRMMVGVKFICALFWWWWNEEGGNEVRRDGRCTALTVHGDGVQQYSDYSSLGDGIGIAAVMAAMM